MNADVRLPDWLRKPLSNPAHTRSVRRALARHRLYTVCDEARCPNRAECFSEGTATFMILGDCCTRDCRFCAVGHGDPARPDRTEPGRVAAAVRDLGLRHVVVTSVTRDDLPDGGAGEFARTIDAIRAEAPEARVEVLVPDFEGDIGALTTVLESSPDVLGHNIETVERLYPSVRRGADYRRSLELIERVGGSGSDAATKSALMLGLGESPDEVHATLKDLRAAGTSLLCVGQYLRPSRQHQAVAKFISPAEFREVARFARSLGFQYVAAGPFVRSSYHADLAVREEARSPRAERRRV